MSKHRNNVDDVNGEFLPQLSEGDSFAQLVEGGEKPHIGSVVIACPDKSKKVNYTIWTDAGHKDNIVAEDAATELMKSLNFDKNVVVIAGLHIDNATREDLDRLVKNSNNLVKNLLASDFFKSLLV